MTNKMQTIRKLLLLTLLFASLATVVQGQVTIGSGDAPQPYSVLELFNDPATHPAGLRLPQMTTVQRDNIKDGAATFQSNTNRATPYLYEGLTIYNTTTRCVEYYDAHKWISMCSGSQNFETTCDDSPIAATGGSKDCGVTDPNCSEAGEYKFDFVSGSEFVHLTVLDAGQGKFKLDFDANNEQATPRTAILMVISPCGNSNMLVYTQNGDDTSCGNSVAFTITSENGTNLCGTGAAYLKLSVSSGTYIWTLNGKEVGRGYNYVATQSGKYIVYADKIGCTTSQTITVSIAGGTAPAPVAIVVKGNNGLVCGAGGTTKLIAQKPATGTVRWFKDGALQNVTTPDNEVDAPEGEWFAVVTDGTCWSVPSEKVTVSVDPNSGAALTEPVIVVSASFCAGSTVQLSVSDGTYNAANTYTWYENNTQIGTGKYLMYNVPQGATDVVIRCRATGAGCSIEAIGTQTITAGIIPSRPTISGTKVLCSGSTTLNVIPTSAGTFTYAWYKDNQLIGTTQSITINAGGDYYATVTDGCTSPQAKVTIDATSSAAPTVTLNRSAESPNQHDLVTYAASINFTPATNYAWAITNASLQSGGGNTANAVVKFDNTGVASVKVVVSNACGTGEATHTISSVLSACANPITVYPATNTAVSTVTRTAVTLGNVSATFSSGTPTAKYQWYSNATNSNTSGTLINGATSTNYLATNNTAGTYYYYCEVSNANCASTTIPSGVYAVTVTQNPASIPTGGGTFAGKTCFDVVATNDGGSCATLTSRAAQKADFTLAATNTQTYTFTTSGTVSKIRFVNVNTNGDIIESITPGSSAWETATNLSGNYTLSVKFRSDLNKDQSLNGAGGLTREQALKSIIYVVYNNNAAGTGSDVMLKLDISVQDCTCCPGYLAVGGEYVQKTAGYLTFANVSAIAVVKPYFTATGKNICFFKTDAKASTTITWNAATNSGAGNLCGTDATYTDADAVQMGGWRLPTVAELGNIQSVHASLITQPTSAPGTANMRTSYYWSSSEDSSPYAWYWNFNNSTANMSGKTNRNCVRCVRSL